MATFEPLHIDAGATYGPRVFTYKDAEGLPFNFTGYTGAVQVRDTDSDSAVASVVPSLNSSTGEITFTLSAAQTALLTKPRYRWGLEITKGTETIRIVQGRVSVSAEVVK